MGYLENPVQHYQFLRLLSGQVMPACSRGQLLACCNQIDGYAMAPRCLQYLQVRWPEVEKVVLELRTLRVFERLNHDLEYAYPVVPPYHRGAQRRDLSQEEVSMILDEILELLPESAQLILVLPLAPARLYRIRPLVARTRLQEIIYSWAESQPRVQVIDPTDWVLAHRQYFEGRRFLNARGQQRYADQWTKWLKN